MGGLKIGKDIHKLGRVHDPRLKLHLVCRLGRRYRFRDQGGGAAGLDYNNTRQDHTARHGQYKLEKIRRDYAPQARENMYITEIKTSVHVENTLAIPAGHA